MIKIIVEIIVEAELKKCKNCRFTAPNLQILGLHVENDHQGLQFECSDCSQKFPFKNKLKLHRRQVHEEGIFACFVCNKKFQTHNKLKEHIQKKCRDNSSNIQPRPTGVENRSLEDSLSAPCVKIVLIPKGPF